MMPEKFRNRPLIDKNSQSVEFERAPTCRVISITRRSRSDGSESLGCAPTCVVFSLVFSLVSLFSVTLPSVTL